MLASLKQALRGLVRGLKERRLESRRVCSGVVQCRTRDRVQDGWLQDLAVDGARIEVDRCILPGRTVELAVAGVSIVGRARWCAPGVLGFLVGVEFVHGGAVGHFLRAAMEQHVALKTFTRRP